MVRAELKCKKLFLGIWPDLVAAKITFWASSSCPSSEAKVTSVKWSASGCTQLISSASTSWSLDWCDLGLWKWSPIRGSQGNLGCNEFFFKDAFKSFQLLSFYFIPGGLDLVSGCILTPLAWSCACKWPRLNIGRRKHCWKSEWLIILPNNHVTIPAWFHSTIACQPFATSRGFALVRSPSDVKLCSDTTKHHY